MARYIDADWIYQMVENRYRISSGIEHRCERDLLDLICEAPTADVVPKSEVEELKAIIADHKASEERWEELYSNTKAEVAREIFEEIEKLLHSLETPINKYWVLLPNELAELKKKYTEDQT